MKIATILGTRPEIIKLSPLIPLLEKEFEHFIIHSGQHYDFNMDKVFFEELKLNKPRYTLNIGSHSQGKQTGMMVEKIEEVLLKEKPNLVIVQGDTNTTMSGALAASKLHIPIMHVESGCRSFNRKMPEEINRIITDHVADYLIAPDKKSSDNLIREGIDSEKIFLLGSTAFDAVTRNKELANVKKVLETLNLVEKEFVLVTLHRAENTNNVSVLRDIFAALNSMTEQTTFVFPIHPRTRRIIEENNFPINNKIKIIEPQSYLDFLSLLAGCKFCMSDSGGIQEEMLVFNKPCLILRNETEWERLVEAGKNLLISTSTEKIITETKRLLLNKEELQRIKEINYPFESGVSEKILGMIRDKLKRGFL